MIHNLLVEIARCPEVAHAQSDRHHSCHQVVNEQMDIPGHDDAHLPEPWSGRIEKACILFVGSNPSIDYDEDFPTKGWDNDTVSDFFENRFGGGLKLWTRQGQALRIDGSYCDANPTWSDIRNRASEILGRPADSGLDYAITETVRGKAKGAIGVNKA